MTSQPLQPLLHDLVATVLAPSSALSGRDGQIRRSGVQGAYHADIRIVAQARLILDGREPDPIACATPSAGTARFVALARWLGDDGPDPTVRLERVRTMTPDGLAETIAITSTAESAVDTTVTLELACDMAPIEVVKSGGEVTAIPSDPVPDGLRWSAPAAVVTVEGGGAEAKDGCLVWRIKLDSREQTVLSWSVRVQNFRAVVRTPAGPPVLARPSIEAADHRLTRLVERSVADLHALLLADAEAPDNVFLGAGVPWFLTLFGRDSLWAARMLLPLGTQLAAGTLRTLARRQGVRLNDDSGEAPGKIMHELRRDRFDLSGGVSLPATYYGTVDATMLWISLLHDAWRWGLPGEDVAELIPHLEAALTWLGEYADADGDGFVEYVDTSGRGLVNQGWKDSRDAIRFRDGVRAQPPIALAEVQAYAYEAALLGAALLDAFDRPYGDRWREYAERLAGRFRRRFWVDGQFGPYPAIALDRDKQPVDAVASNMGHLLGRGLLTGEESAQVAAVLGAPGMDSGFGLRTMSAQEVAYSPLSYHCGSVWPHDTAITIDGLARAGCDDLAARLAAGLLTAAESFDYRLPELFGGDSREEAGRPVPYPAACRPQAWSAAAAVVILRSLSGLEPDAPARRLHLRPFAGAPLGAVTLGGLAIASHSVDLRIDAGGKVAVSGLPADWDIASTA